MFSILTQEFHSSLPLDNSMLVEEIKNGVSISERDVIEVVINARVLFTLSTLTCRELGRVEDCLKLWSETAELIGGLCSSWGQVDAGNHPQITRLLTELSRLRGLCEDRMELYSVTEGERLRHAKTRDSDFEMNYRERHGLEARGQTDHSSPQHIYTLGHI